MCKSCTNMGGDHCTSAKILLGIQVDSSLQHKFPKASHFFHLSMPCPAAKDWTVRSSRMHREGSLHTGTGKSEHAESELGLFSPPVLV